jgi:ABC-type ATPase involved in cell division
VIVADEQWSVDSTTDETILDIFEHMVKEGKTIIMVYTCAVPPTRLQGAEIVDVN